MRLKARTSSPKGNGVRKADLREVGDLETLRKELGLGTGRAAQTQLPEVGSAER